MGGEIMRRKHLTFTLVFLLLCSFIALVAVSQQKSIRQLENEMETAYKNLYNPDYGAWPVYTEAFDDLEAKIRKFIEDHEKLKSISLSPKLDPGSALLDGIDKNLQAFQLSSSMNQQLVEIETLGNKVEFLWLDVQAAWYAYYDAVGAYNYAVSPNERVGIREPSKQTPTPLYFCAGPCDDLFETASLAQVSHQVYCPEKHGSSGTTGVTYYTCSGSCDRSDEHWRVCGGSCGNKYAPKKVHRQGNLYVWVANSPHYVKCTESVYGGFWNPNAICGKEYFTCEHSTCPDSSSRHWSSSSPIVSPTPTPTAPSDDTPNCPDCTSHCSSPCSCSNSGTCNGAVVDNTPDCSYCTDGCSSCQSSGDGNTGNGGSGYTFTGECTQCGGANFYTCVYCDQTFDTCYVHLTSCGSSPYGWHSSVQED